VAKKKPDAYAASYVADKPYLMKVKNSKTKIQDSKLGWKSQ